MSIDLVQAELRHTLELSAALGRRSENLRPHCSRVTVQAMELMTAFTVYRISPDRLVPALAGIRSVNQTLARAAAAWDPDSQKAVERDLVQVLPTLEEFRREFPRLPPTQT